MISFRSINRIDDISQIKNEDDSAKSDSDYPRPSISSTISARAGVPNRKLIRYFLHNPPNTIPIFQLDEVICAQSRHSIKGSASSDDFEMIFEYATAQTHNLLANKKRSRRNHVKNCLADMAIAKSEVHLIQSSLL